MSLVPSAGSTAPDATIPIHDLLAGQSACIHRIVGHPDHVHRLHEFGLCDGVRIEMFRPGNPCIIRIAGNKICIRADELFSVLVVPTGI
jgi:Fe2+ transport system protein FeoA